MNVNVPSLAALLVSLAAHSTTAYADTEMVDDKRNAAEQVNVCGTDLCISFGSVVSPSTARSLRAVVSFLEEPGSATSISGVYDPVGRITVTSDVVAGASCDREMPARDQDGRFVAHLAVPSANDADGECRKITVQIDGKTPADEAALKQVDVMIDLMGEWTGNMDSGRVAAVLFSLNMEDILLSAEEQGKL